MPDRMCDNNPKCIWSDADRFCHSLMRAKVPLDDKWPLLILQLRGIGHDVAITADQKAALQDILVDTLSKKDFSDKNYRAVRRDMTKIYNASLEKQIREITLEVNAIAIEASKILGSHTEDMLSVASSVDVELDRGIDPSDVLSTLRQTLKDIISKMEQDSVLFKDLATKDALTGLANRRSFDSYLNESVELFTKKETPISLFFFDIDHFKQFNDKYGHLVGDQVLKRLASFAEKCAKSMCGAEDSWMVSRFGGDEFALVARGPITENLNEFASNLCKGVANSSLLIRDVQGNVLENGLKVTISIGVTTMHKDWSDNYIANLISYADKALYEAKRNGKNCAGLYDPTSGSISVIKSEEKEEEELSS